MMTSMVNGMEEGLFKPTQGTSFNDIASLVTKAVGDVMGDLPTPVNPGPSGQPSTPPRAVTRTERPTSPDEADDAALEIILNGGTLDDAKRAAMRR